MTDKNLSNEKDEDQYPEEEEIEEEEDVKLLFLFPPMIPPPLLLLPFSSSIPSPFFSKLYYVGIWAYPHQRIGNIYHFHFGKSQVVT